MARLVKFTEKGPKKIEGKNGDIYICMCGLSKDFPFCDGSHKRTRDEEEGKVYVYSEEGRVEL